MAKEIVFDSSSLISLIQVCSGNLLTALASELKADFWISESVKSESISRPLGIKRFELNALRINGLLKEGSLKLYPKSKALDGETRLLAGLANGIYSIDGGRLEIIHAGEAESLAITNLTEADVLCIDERTTRLLVESPLELRNLLAFKHKAKVRVDEKKLNEFKASFEDIKIIRSSELVALAFDKGFVTELKMVEGLLFALKYAGCSISEQEINSFLNESRKKN